MAQLNARLQAIAKREGGPMFMGWPDRWLDDPHWRCLGNHVSTMVLKSEMDGQVCLAGGCRTPVHLTFPEDRDGPLPVLPEDQP